jgi:hypothetical protein
MLRTVLFVGAPHRRELEGALAVQIEVADVRQSRV